MGKMVKGKPRKRWMVEEEHFCIMIGFILFFFRSPYSGWRKVFKILTDKPTEKRPLRGPRLRWEDNIKMVLNINTRNRVDSSQDTYNWRALLNEKLNLRIS